MAVGVAFLGVEVSVGDLAVGVALAPTGGVFSPTLLVGMEWEYYRSYWLKTNWHRTREALMDAAVFPTLVLGLRVVRDIGPPLDGGERKVLLQHLDEGRPLIQIWPSCRHSQALPHMNFMVGRCVQH